MEPNIQTSIKQLNDARNLVLSDAAYYQQILPGILPVIQNAQAVEIRRWGAEFLAEMFASPAVSSSQKEALCLTVLETLRLWIESEGEDAAVVRSVVQCAASVYPLVVRWTYVYPFPFACLIWL
jgi:symplekin